MENGIYIRFFVYEMENVIDNWFFIKFLKCVYFIVYFKLGYYKMCDYLFI